MQVLHARNSIMAYLSDLRESVCKVSSRLGRAGDRVLRQGRALIPSQCPLCTSDALGGALCWRCHALIERLGQEVTPRCAGCGLNLDTPPVCPDCSARPPAFDRIIAAFDYCAPGDFLIHRLKVERRFTDARMLGQMLADRVQHAWPGMPDDVVLVPVPSSSQAIRRRGFNPAAEVARVLARRLERPLRPDVLRRIRDGHKQATLDRETRLMSTSRLYDVAADVRGVRIVVVDDVMTTGSTLHSIAVLLKRAGALSVHGVVLARTPRSSRAF